jgi:ornithine--oxo-acid transaminase
VTIDMKALIEQHITSSDHLAKKHIHPRLVKMMAMGGMSIAFTKAQGPHLYDQEGTKYLDLLAGGGVHFIGRNHPVVNKALMDVLSMDIPNLCVVNSSVLGGLLAEKLTTLAGGNIGKVQFANSGTEATEVCIRFARFATRRRRFLYLEGAFHGRSYGAISLCGFKQMKEGMDPMMPTVTPIRMGDIEALRRELAREDVAGLFYEAVQGMTCEVADPAWLREAESLCRKHGTLLIADEVQTGLGRLGSWFAAPEMGIRPDMMTISKTLSGGHMPVSCVLVSEDVYANIFAKFKSGPIYFSTFAENNLAMAAGLATIDVLETIDAPRRARELSAQLRNGLMDIQSRYDCIDRIAGKGLMIACYFKDSQKKRLRAQQAIMGAADAGSFAASVNVEMMKSQRVIVQIPGPELNAIKILPPVTLEDADVNWFLNGFEDVMASFYGRNGPVLSLGRAVAKDAMNNVRQAIPIARSDDKAKLPTEKKTGLNAPPVEN